jgi:P-type Ca2+ transporter type 2C
MSQFVERRASSEEVKIVWHALSETEVLAKLDAPPRTGLTAAQVDERRLKYGLNELVETKRTTFMQMVIGQLNNFVVILLIVAALVSALLGDWVEASAIMAIVVLNAILGVIQENRAEQALAALKKLAAPEAHVLRDGKRITIPARELVPGDMVYLEAGNFVPADVRLLEAANLRIEEAALTGESVPVEKVACGRLESDIPIGDRKNTAFMGTTVNYGRGRGVVVCTGMLTQLGLIADMLQNVDEEETPLQQRLEHLGKLLGYGALAICGLVFLVGILRASAINIETITEMFMIAVSLAIAAVPEGLPAVVTISLALGMREMIRRNALIRKLASVETLGSATVICSDKTGTLTQNEMTVTRMWVDGQEFHITGSGYATRGDFVLDGKTINVHEYPGLLSALWVGVLNNDSSLESTGEDEPGGGNFHMVGDPTEGSLLVAAAKADIFASDLSSCFPREEEIPFDSARKRMVTIHDVLQVDPGDVSPIYDADLYHWHVIAVKGAPDIVLDLCNRYDAIDDRVKPLDDQARQRILAANDAMTSEALRVLGMAYRLVPIVPDEINNAEMEKDLIFVGLAGMIDPARPEVSPAMEKARTAGIRTIMITGDYPNTARAIAGSIGLLNSEHQVLTGTMLNEMDDAQLQQAVLHTDVFARVSPEHKMRIVDALRANREVVAMTGDGVNDAPAIKRADIGVAMGITGTDVAKETADMVLTDDNYASIVSAIEQGRIIYSNIRKFVYYLLSCNLAEIMIIFLATLITGRSPLAAIQLLWLNLVTDGAPALALATEKGDPDIMNQPPRPTREPIINRYMTIGIIIQTIAITAVTLAAYFIGRATNILYAETMAFVTLSVSELLRAYTARSEYYPLLKIGIFKNKWMNYGVLTSLLLILVVIYVPFLNEIFGTLPLGWQQWAQIMPLLIFPSVAAELTKFFFSPTRNNPAKQPSGA